MSFRRRLAQLDLVVVVVLAVALELALNRLATNVLRPPGARPPPSWHRVIDQAGLFLLYGASLLALGACVWKTWELLLRRDLIAEPVRLAMAGASSVFLALAGWSICASAPRSLSFHLESIFTLFLLLVGMALTLRPGDRRARLGYLAVIAPLLLHYYATFALNLLLGPEAARASSIPDRARAIGQYSLAAVGLCTPLLLGPRPLLRSFARPAPLVVAGFVGALAAITLREHYEAAVEIAWNGLGIELGPGAPGWLLTTYVLAITAVTWTLAATLSSTSPARRSIGVGLLLVVLAGYSYAWPLYLLCATLGALAVADGALHVREEEDDARVRTALGPGAHLAPTIWRAYVDALAGALGAEARLAPRDDVEETCLTGQRRGLPFTLRILRAISGLHAIEVTLGDAPADEHVEPSWTLAARDAPRAGPRHPAPPFTRAPGASTGDEVFDRRFRLQDGRALTGQLLDDDLRARAAALLDGWIAVWPARGLRYRVYPGRGAPVDHPIPVGDLARHGDPAAASEHLTRVVDLLAELAVRAGVAPGAA